MGSSSAFLARASTTLNQRLSRLIARHVVFGRSPEEAHQRSLGPDGCNEEMIMSLTCQ
jgi:hypothetical protein